MLQTIHDKVTGWVAGLVIALIGVPFIFWGIDVGFGTVSYAAKVKGHDEPFWRSAAKISLQDLNRAYQNQMNQYQQMLRGEVPPEVRTEIQSRLMDGFVRRELIEQHADRLGYRVRNEDVARAIQERPEFQMEGKYNAELAERVLDSQGISRRKYREDMRSDLQVAQIQASIVASSFVTPAEIERAHALESEEREVAWAIVDPATLSAGIEPTDAAIADYYAKNKKDFMTPETVTLKYIELKVADLAAKVNVTDEALRAYYENVKDRYVEPERRKSRHILVKVDQGGDESAARKKADEVLAKVKAPGADFSALAKQLSDDAGSAEQGGDLGWAERSFFVGPFSDALFAMQLNEIRGPVRSEFGYHIIRLDGIQAGKQKSFEEARAELESEYRTQEAEKLFGDRQEQLAEKAFENLDNLDKVASDTGLTVQSVPDFKRTGGGVLGQNADVIAAAFSDNVLLNGQNSEPIEVEPGHLIVLRADDRKSPQERPLSEVRGEIATLLKKQGAEQLARKRGEDALAKLKAGTPWATAVADLKVQAQGPKFVSRTDADVPGGLRQALFLAPKLVAGKPYYQTVALPGGEYGLMAFSGVRAGSASETTEQRETRVRQAAMRIQRTEVTAYVEELRRKADVDTNPKAFE